MCLHVLNGTSEHIEAHHCNASFHGVSAVQEEYRECIVTCSGMMSRFEFVISRRAKFSLQYITKTFVEIERNAHAFVV